MNAILLGSLICYANLVIGFLVPAMFLHWKLLHTNRSPTRTDYVLQCLGLGSLYAAAQLLILQSFSLFDSETKLLAVGAKLAMDICFSGIWSSSYREQLGTMLRWLSPVNWRRTSILQFSLGIIFGMLSMLWVPYALDNSAIIWVINALEIENFPIQNSQGAISYIALLYFPGFLLDGVVPVTTVAASLKTFLSLLLALVALKLATACGKLLSLDENSIGLQALALQMILLTTALAKYGVFDTGKETVFAILFLFAFAANLMNLQKSENAYWTSALPLAAAIGFGAITVPYAIILVSAFAFLSFGKIRTWQFGLACTVVSSIPLWVSFHAMLDWSWLKAALPMLGCCTGLLLLDRWEFRFSLPTKLPFVMLAITIIGVVLLMPVEFHHGRYPLDGTTSALDLFVHKNKFFLPGFIGAIVCLSYMYRGKLEQDEGMHSFLLFPWCAMLTVLVVIHTNSYHWIGLHPQNVWDWAKDVPRWISGIYLGTLAIFFWNELSLFLRARMAEYSGRWNLKILTTLALMILAVFNVRTVAKRMNDFDSPVYSTIGGSSDWETAEFVSWAYLARKNKQLFTSEMDPIIVSADSSIQNREYFFKMYGVHCRTEESLPANPRPNRRLWFVCDVKEVKEFTASVVHPDDFVIKSVFDLGRESVFSLVPRHSATKTASNEKLKINTR